MHLRRQLNCWSLRCSWSIACRRCSNYIFIIHFTPGFSGLGKDNCKTRRGSFKFCDLVRRILEILRYFHTSVCFSCIFIFPCSPDLWYQTDPHWYSTERDWGDHVVRVAWEVTMDAGSVLEKDQGKTKWGPFQYKDHILTINFDPNWAFPDWYSSLNSPMATKWCKKLEVA